MADDNFEDDIFDDLYDEEPASKSAPAAAPVRTEPEPANAQPVNEPVPDISHNMAESAAPVMQEAGVGAEDSHMDGSAFNGNGNQAFDNAPLEDDNYGPINVKEDG